MTKQQLHRSIKTGILARIEQKLVETFERKKQGDRKTDRLYAQLLESRDRLKKPSR